MKRLFDKIKNYVTLKKNKDLSNSSLSGNFFEESFKELADSLGINKKEVMREASIELLGKWAHLAKTTKKLLINLLTADDLYNLGLVFLKRNETDSAIKIFDDIITYFPDYVPAFYGKGTALQYIGQYKKSLNFFDRALSFPGVNKFSLTNDRQGDSKAELMLSKGISYLGLKEINKAISCFDEVLKKYPHHKSALLYKRNILGKREND